MAGEGHFLALFKKEGTSHSIALGSPSSKIEKSSKKLLEGFFMGSSVSLDLSRIEIRGGHVYCLPEAGPESVKGLKFLRWGLYLGEMKKNRFEPGQPLAMALSGTAYPRILDLAPSDQRAERYLKGETLLLSEEELSKGPGWYLVCISGYPLGWGKATGNLLKNKYPSGWRLT